MSRMRKPVRTGRCPGSSNRGEPFPTLKEQLEGTVSPELEEPKIGKRAPTGVNSTEKQPWSKPQLVEIKYLVSLSSPSPVSYMEAGSQGNPTKELTASWGMRQSQGTE